jgi:hypothetical protein
MNNENGDMIQFRWRESTHMISSGPVLPEGTPHRHDGPYHAIPGPPVLEYRLHFMPSMFRPLVSDVIVLKEIPEDMKRWVEVPTK